jgi:hypothetical protein
MYMPWEKKDGARASHKCGAPTPLPKSYKYMNTLNEYLKNNILYDLWK